MAEVHAGPGALARCAGFDRLAERLGLPVTARLDYLSQFAMIYPEWQPWVVGVSGMDGAWQAGALLTMRRRNGVTVVSGLAHQVCDHGRLPAANGLAAAALAEAIAVGLAALPGPWALRLEQLPVEDPVVALLAGRLDQVEIVPGVGLPRIQLSDGHSPRTYLTKKYRSQTRAARRRFEAAGVEPRLVFRHTAAEIEPLLADLVEIRRTRDRAAYYRAELADRRRAAWWQAALLRFAERGQLELTLLDVGAGPPAAYNAALVDGRSYRFWDGRINPSWHQQWPGQLLFGELLPQLIADPRWSEVDYLRGETPFKMRTATDVVPTSRLLAWSSQPARLVAETPGLVHRWLHDWKSRHPAAERIWRVARTRLGG
ncbi:MAG TPA: GNAT family N-acetyltransferase [Mycobacteriales bacterium]|nr:GNAT family N-acetyltransferase [Mycobacteriales bacterium]